ncbi:bacteriophage protein [Streptomyces sp. SPB074]|nr:bacteriophage protein [Streptomyces sp. SPB074]
MRMYTRGTLDLTRRQFTYTDDTEADFWRLVDKSAGADGCWLWLGTLTVQGYGSWLHAPAHRISYRYEVGEVPKGLVLDHVCHDPKDCPRGAPCPHRRCVNPAHLKPVTHAENVSSQRSRGGRPSNDVCSVEGCGNPYVARGLCSKHWQAARRMSKQPMTTCSNGHPLAGPDADVRVDGRGHRICRHCKRLAAARRKAAAAANGEG